MDVALSVEHLARATSSDFAVQNPTLVKELGAVAVGIALSIWPDRSVADFSRSSCKFTLTPFGHPKMVRQIADRRNRHADMTGKLSTEHL
jgi:hypothetical protein